MSECYNNILAKDIDEEREQRFSRIFPGFLFRFIILLGDDCCDEGWKVVRYSFELIFFSF